jgi:hypothetical protein
VPPSASPDAALDVRADSSPAVVCVVIRRENDGAYGTNFLQQAKQFDKAV